MNYSQKGWQWITLENVLQTLETGKRPKGGVLHQDSGVLSISAEHMTPSGGIDTSIGRFVPVDFYQAMKKGKVQPGDVLVVKDGATTGKTAYADNSLQGEPLAVNEHVFICRPNRDVINPRFLFYWLWSEEGWAQIRTCYQGSTIGGINRSFIQKVTVPLPPLCEQQRIAGILNEQMAYVEKARKAAEEILEAAQALPGAFLRQVFPAHGDALPASWKWAKLGDVLASIQPGFACGKRDEKGVAQLRMNNITTDGRFNWDKIIRIPPNYTNMFKYWLEPGDVLFNNTNSVELVGKSAIFLGFHEKVVYSNHFNRLRPDTNVLDTSYLANWLLYNWTHGLFARMCNRWVGQAAVPRSKLLALKIPLPPLSEQKRIAALLNEQMAYVETVRMSAREQLDAINALPNALLRRAFAGNC